MTKSVDVAQSLLGLTFLGSGGAKLAGQMQGEFERFGYPRWFRRAVGAAEMTAGVGFLAGLRHAPSAVAAGVISGSTMAGALWTHLVRAGDPPLHAAPAGALLALSAWIAVRRGNELVRGGAPRPEHRAMPHESANRSP